MRCFLNFLPCADFIREVAGGEPAVLVGNSLGGYNALSTAAFNQDLVRWAGVLQSVATEEVRLTSDGAVAWVVGVCGCVVCVGVGWGVWVCRWGGGGGGWVGVGGCWGGGGCKEGAVP